MKKPKPTRSRIHAPKNPTQPVAPPTTPPTLPELLDRAIAELGQFDSTLTAAEIVAQEVKKVRSAAHCRMMRGALIAIHRQLLAVRRDLP